jgi:predicted RNase H-like HicB family nuclease
VGCSRDHPIRYSGVVDELIFEVTQEADGGYCAECLTEAIFTQGDTWEQLRANVLEAVDAFYFDRPKPSQIRMHLVRDEVLATGR